MACMREYRPQSWAFKATVWRDAEWDAAVVGPRLRRSRMGPWTRWENPLLKFCRERGLGNWKRLAQNRDDWAAHGCDFIRFVGK